jgi:hypothetical protein
MEIPYPSSVQVEYGMELEDDTVQWALHVSQAGRKGEGKGTYACADLASSQSSKPVGQTERERAVFFF